MRSVLFQLGVNRNSKRRRSSRPHSKIKLLLPLELAVLTGKVHHATVFSGLPRSLETEKFTVPLTVFEFDRKRLLIKHPAIPHKNAASKRSLYRITKRQDRFGFDQKW